MRFSSIGCTSNMSSPEVEDSFDFMILRLWRQRIDHLYVVPKNRELLHYMWVTDRCFRNFWERVRESIVIALDILTWNQGNDPPLLRNSDSSCIKPILYPKQWIQFHTEVDKGQFWLIDPELTGSGNIPPICDKFSTLIWLIKSKSHWFLPNLKMFSAVNSPAV